MEAPKADDTGDAGRIPTICKQQISYLRIYGHETAEQDRSNAGVSIRKVVKRCFLSHDGKCHFNDDPCYTFKAKPVIREFPNVPQDNWISFRYLNDHVCSLFYKWGAEVDSDRSSLNDVTDIVDSCIKKEAQLTALSDAEKTARMERKRKKREAESDTDSA